jgi:large subunit ribosomal protein L23
MYIKPVLTEKSLNEAKKGKYTFFVEPSLNKFQIKRLINETFDVHVVSIKSLKSKREVKRIYTGRKRIIQPKKKTIVTLKEKEKIDIIETKKK